MRYALYAYDADAKLALYVESIARTRISPALREFNRARKDSPRTQVHFAVLYESGCVPQASSPRGVVHRGAVGFSVTTAGMR